MLITICVLILAYMIMGKDIKPLLEKVKDIDWKGYCTEAWEKIKKYSKKVGRVTCEKCLKLWYVLEDPSTPTLEKALIYGAIIYTISPWSLASAAKYGIFGVLDEFVAINFVINRVSKRITPDIENKVKSTLDEWFGPEYSTSSADVK